MRALLTAIVAVSSAHAAIDTSQCDTTLTCFYYPTGCSLTDSGDCVVVAWSAGTSDVTFEINRKLASGSDSGYAGLALATSASMTNGDTYVCEKGSAVASPTLSSQWIVGRTRPSIASTQNHITVLSETFDSSTNIMACQFTRPDSIADTASETYSAYNTGTNSYFLLVAYGGYDTQIAYHSNTKTASSAAINFKTAPANAPTITAATVVRVTERVRLIHGSFMLLAWGVLVKVAVFSASFMKNGQGDDNRQIFAKDSTWFEVHRWANSSAIVLTVIGVVLAFYVNDWKFIAYAEGNPASRKYHAIFGIVVLSLGCFNFLLGLVRPDKESEYRKYFNFTHIIVGTLAMGFSDYVIVSGLLLFRLTEWHWTSIFWLVFVGIVFVLMTFLRPVLWKLRSKWLLFGYGGFALAMYVAIIVGINVD